MSNVAIFCAYIVTAFNALNMISGDLVKAVTVICSLITSFSTSYLALTRCREKWKIYRDAIESIKRLLVLYWSDSIQDNNLKCLISEIEKLKDTEYKKWSDTYNTLAEDVLHKNPLSDKQTNE